MKPVLEAIRRVEREGKLSADWNALEVRHTENGSFAAKIPVTWKPFHDRQNTLKYLEAFLHDGSHQTVSKEVETDFGNGTENHFLLIQQQTTPSGIQKTIRTLREFGTIVKLTKPEDADAPKERDDAASSLNRLEGGQGTSREQKARLIQSGTDGFVAPNKPHRN